MFEISRGQIKAKKRIDILVKISQAEFPEKENLMD
jgi:hypothetical protein